MKRRTVPLFIISFICIVCAIAIYITSKDYPTVGYITYGDCLIPDLTSLQVVALVFGVFSVLSFSSAFITLWRPKKLTER